MARTDYLSEVDKLAEIEPHVWVKKCSNKRLRSQNIQATCLQVERAFMLSGAAKVGEDAFLLTARYLPDENKLKFKGYRQSHDMRKWDEIPVNSNNTILYGLPHYVENVASKQDADIEVDKLFAEFRQKMRS